ncbi:PE-PPE domain-containing protein [Mycolicibacterium iranicum]|uniref:PE-PPE domain-containing protein n=1 Tax=Mycolicibacterium iranicum TaxID=912594 RepID=A0A1X1W9M5_MYCIR|nr:PE-PPE domain-containing protein [Mycolicibacterium iranicum]ORV83220.1 PE-PPE domain-containing protein [Mycolicibacterium iranicum]
MHSALRPYMTTGLAIVGSSVIALAPIAPPAPAVGAATTTKQVTQDVTLSARVITINPSPQELEMGEQLNGTVCGGNGTPCYELDYVPIFTNAAGYFGFGVKALQENLTENLGEDTTIFAFSEGATVASQWLKKHLENPGAYPAPEKLTFVVIGNPTRKYGGSLFLTPWPESPYKVIDVAMQYDPTVDQPKNTLNSLAVLNAAMGFFTNHLGKGYSDVDLDDPANSKWTEGNIEYVFVPSKTLPIVEPLRWIGLNQLADDLTPGLQYLIEQGYDRDDRITNTTITAPDKSWSYIPINLAETIANIPYYAVAGTNRFAEAMRASGSWWVYTPVNVLGWDPANPEMTRAFVDFLIAIPSISEPLGEIADYWARANLPMNAGCTGFPPCDNPAGITDQMFKVMLWDLFSPNGYKFTSPITPEYNPVSSVEGFWGQELGLTGDEVKWHDETVYLTPFQETTSFWDHLMSRPEGIKTPTLQDQFKSFGNLLDALNTTWNPFVPMSYVWNPKMTPFAYLARPFAKLLCPKCNKTDPFMPTGWKVGLDIYPGAYIPPSVKNLYDPKTGEYIGDPVEGLTAEEIAAWRVKSGIDPAPSGDQQSTLRMLSVSDTEETTDEGTGETASNNTETSTDDTAPSAGTPDVVTTAVQDLVDKFQNAPVEGEETPTPETGPEPEAETPQPEPEPEPEAEVETPEESTTSPADEDGADTDNDERKTTKAERSAAQAEATAAAESNTTDSNDSGDSGSGGNGSGGGSGTGSAGSGGSGGAGDD